MKKKIFLLLTIVLFMNRAYVTAQTDTGSTSHRIAIFVPLYLDSAFDAAGNYRFDKNFPKFLNQGLEFYEGAQMALDSLQKTGAKLDVHIYDTHSKSNAVAQVLQEEDFKKTELIIGHVTAGDLRLLAAEARSKNIPFINVNFPNDGGVTNNPDFVILNTTLKTHCEGIYKYLQKNYSTSKVIVFRKKSAQEDKLKSYFTDEEKNTVSVPLALTYVNLDEPVTTKQLLPYLDSTKQNLFVAASLSDNFARSLCSQLSKMAKTYPTTVIGMPVWDNIDFSEPEYSGLEIVYSTPFYMNPTDNLVKSIQQDFKSKFMSRPSDMVFRGYETLFRFAELLQQYGSNLSGSIGEKKFKVFNDFDIQPVFLNKQNMTLDLLRKQKTILHQKSGR